MLVAAWQSEIAKARQDGTDPLTADAEWFKKALTAATTPAEKRKIMAAIELEAENLASPTFNEDVLEHLRALQRRDIACREGQGYREDFV